jgi:hypothetical protein
MSRRARRCRFAPAAEVLPLRNLKGLALDCQKQYDAIDEDEWEEPCFDDCYGDEVEAAIEMANDAIRYCRCAHILTLQACQQRLWHASRC